MRKQILTDNETKSFLMKTFNCTRQAVWQALTFQRNSDQARRIRHLALQRGGKLTDGYAPKCETSYEEGEKTMKNKLLYILLAIVGFAAGSLLFDLVQNLFS